MPELDALQKQYSITQVRVITLGDDSLSTIKQYARSNAALFLRDSLNSVWDVYSQNGFIPLNYVIRPNGKVYDWMEGYDGEIIKSWIDSCMVGIEEENTIAKTETPKLIFSPNPFKTMTVISINGLEAGNLQIHDLSGRIVKSFSLNSNSKVTWDRKENNGRALPAGVYFCKLNLGKVNLTQKITILE